MLEQFNKNISLPESLYIKDINGIKIKEIPSDSLVMIGSGGTARVYSFLLNGIEKAMKIYTSQILDKYSCQYECKLKDMINSPPTQKTLKIGDETYSQFIWPEYLVEDEQNRVIGYVMPILDKVNVYELGEYLSLSPFEENNKDNMHMSIAYRVQLACNLAGAMNNLHKSGHYFVDVKQQNIFVFKKSSMVCFIDCDGFSISKGEFPAQHYTRSYQMPEILNNNLTPEEVSKEPYQDYYCLAHLIFEILNYGVRPFSCKPKEELLEEIDASGEDSYDFKVKNAVYVYGISMYEQASPISMYYKYLPKDILQLFEQAFTGKYSDIPSARVWFRTLKKYIDNKDFEQCENSKDYYHQHFKEVPCFACNQNNKIIGFDLKPIDDSLNLMNSDCLSSNFSLSVISNVSLSQNENDKVVSQDESNISLRKDKGLKTKKKCFLFFLLMLLMVFVFLFVKCSGNVYYLIAEYYSNKQEYEKSVYWFEKSATQGNIKGLAKLGWMYQFNPDIKDYQQAWQWNKKAAEQGSITGQINLGYMYEYGQGVDKNYEEAVRWYQIASERGDANAQYNLGVMYELGNGVGRNYEIAVNWYRKAAEQGYASGQTALGSMYEYGKGVDKNYETAVSWYRKAAEQGNARGQYHLGMMYQYGTGVEKNDEEAIKWYRESARKGNKDSRKALENMTTVEKVITIDSDVLFDFGEYILKESAKKDLASLINEIEQFTQDRSIASITIMGHTDRIGDMMSNVILGQRRADNVKAFFVKQGFDSSKIYTVSYGDDSSVTGDVCDSVKGRKALIACLAPDRRIEIRVEMSLLESNFDLLNK